MTTDVSRHCPEPQQGQTAPRENTELDTGSLVLTMLQGSIICQPSLWLIPGDTGHSYMTKCRRVGASTSRGSKGASEGGELISRRQNGGEAVGPVGGMWWDFCLTRSTRMEARRRQGGRAGGRDRKAAGSAQGKGGLGEDQDLAEGCS